LCIRVRVHDVRAELRGDRLMITSVLVGRRALLEHFGLGIGHGRQGRKLRTAAAEVPWDAVVRLASGKVVVQDGTEAGPDKAKTAT
jgi:hypothetical protein